MTIGRSFLAKQDDGVMIANIGIMDRQLVGINSTTSGFSELGKRGGEVGRVE